MPSNINPASFIPWKKPVADIHPRLWITNRRKVAIGSIQGGSFTHGSTIIWSGGSGKVVGDTANGAAFLYYEPVSGTQVAPAQTITQGAVNTLSFAAAVADGLTVAAAQAKTTGNSFWTQVQNYANNNNTESEKGLSVDGSNGVAWVKNQDWTRLACLAIHYLLTGNTTSGNRARDVALFYAGISSWGLSESGHRERLLSMAFAYDYCWPLFSDTQKNTVASKMKTEIATISSPDSERLWGTDHGKMCYALASQIGIMEDTFPFTTAECNTLVSDMDTMMDALDNGTSGASGTSFFSAFRYFGDVDKGTHKGSGSKSYFTVNEEFYSFLMPAVRSGLVFDMYSDNPWFKNTMEWIFQHLRTDYKSHTQGDHRHLSSIIIDITTAAHALQVVQRDTDYVAKACQWFASELVPFVANQPFTSSNNLFPFIFGVPVGTLPSVAPTLADFNGGAKARDFTAVGKTIFRTGFPTISNKQFASLAFHWPRYFLADHQHRDMGHLSLEGYGEPLLISLGHYDPNQSFPFQTSLYVQGTQSTWELHSGHRHSFQMQSLSKSTIRIYSELDDDTAALRLNGYQKFLVASSQSFGKSTDDNTWVAGPNGVSNYGGFLWPKNTGDSDAAAETLAELLGEPKWRDLAILSHTQNAPEASYRVVDGKGWFWSGKCSRWKRHVLMLHEDQIPGYPYPIFIVWDDIISLIGAASGSGVNAKGSNKTQIFQLCTTCPAQSVSGDNLSCFFQRTASSPKLFVRFTRPTAMSRDQFGGTSFQAFRDADGVIYAPNETYPEDDSVFYGSWKTEWYGQNASTTRNFICALMPTPSSVSVVPTVEAIDEVGYVGIAFTFGANTLEVRMAKGDTHSMVIGGIAPTPPPATPTNLVGVPGDAQVSLNWDDNTELDFDHYIVYRTTKVAGVYGPDVPIASPVASTYLDTAVTNGVTYKYRVSAVNAGLLESAPTAYTAELTPSAIPSDIGMANRHFSGELWIGSVPMPDDELTDSDIVHTLDLYSAIAAQPPPPPPPPPPIDISIGAPIVPDVGPLAGAPITSDVGPLGGAPITSDVGPLVGAPIAV